MSEEEWGPWIEHDGSGCPVPMGYYVQCETKRPITGLPPNYRKVSERIFEGRIGKHKLGENDNSWNWRKGNWIIRYRIRKPRGLTILESLLTDLPERVDA